MTAPAWVALAVLGLVVSVKTKLTFTVAGSAVQMPVLWLAFAAVTLALAALVLVLARQLLRDGLRLRPRVVTL